MRKRLTVHLSDVDQKYIESKSKFGEIKKQNKIFNTLSFEINSEPEIQLTLKGLKSKGLIVKKHYLSNIK